jgi:Tfp pilus assembly protein PilV
MTRSRVVTAIEAAQQDERGMGLIEVLVASLILMVGMVALMGAFTIAIAANAKHGELATRSTFFAVSKLEELMALRFNDTTSDTTVAPVAAAGGTGLADGGGLVQGDPVVGYADFLDANGTRVAADVALYTRQWLIATNAAGTAKTITVVVFSRRTGTSGVAPSTTVASIKAS